MWVANQQGKVSSWSLIWSRLYKDQTKRRSGRGNHLDGKEKREGERGKKKTMMREITTEWGHLKAGALVAEPMKMQETGCGRSLLPGQQSPSPLFVSHGLGTDGTLLPHGRHYRDLWRTLGKDPKHWTKHLNSVHIFCIISRQKRPDSISRNAM